MSYRSNRLVNWVLDEETGHLRPVPTYQPAYTDNQLKALQRAALSNPYKPQPDPETGFIPEHERAYEGMTAYEVALDRRAQLAAQGDMIALDQMENRALGKPKQQIEQTNVNITFSEIVAERVSKGALEFKTVRDELIEQGVIDVTPVQHEPLDDLGF